MNLDGLRELLDAATPGPWGIDGSDRSNWGIRTVAGDQPIIGEMGRAWDVEGERDARLIVALRNLAPELLAVAEAADALCVEVHPTEPEWLNLGQALTALDSRIQEQLP